MPDDKPTDAPEPKEIEFSRAAGFVKLYANNVQIEVSPWDFKFSFGEATRPAPDKLKIEHSVTVFMSPQHAKAMLSVLANNVQEYEAKIGEIKLPDTIEDRPSKPATKKAN